MDERLFHLTGVVHHRCVGNMTITPRSPLQCVGDGRRPKGVLRRRRSRQGGGGDASTKQVGHNTSQTVRVMWLASPRSISQAGPSLLATLLLA